MGQGFRAKGQHRERVKSPGLVQSRLGRAACVAVGTHAGPETGLSGVRPPLMPAPLSAQDSPTNKLLYAKEIPEYRKIVQRYYQQIHDMTPLSEQEMNAHLAEESRVRRAPQGTAGRRGALPAREGLWEAGGLCVTAPTPPSSS